MCLQGATGLYPTLRCSHINNWTSLTLESEGHLDSTQLYLESQLVISNLEDMFQNGGPQKAVDF